MSPPVPQDLRSLNAVAKLFADQPAGTDRSIFGSNEFGKTLGDTVTTAIKSLAGEYVKEHFKQAGQELLQAVAAESAKALV